MADYGLKVLIIRFPELKNNNKKVCLNRKKILFFQKKRRRVKKSIFFAFKRGSFSEKKIYAYKF